MLSLLRAASDRRGNPVGKVSLFIRYNYFSFFNFFLHYLPRIPNSCHKVFQFFEQRETVLNNAKLAQSSINI